MREVYRKLAALSLLRNLNRIFAPRFVSKFVSGRQIHFVYVSYTMHLYVYYTSLVLDGGSGAATCAERKENLKWRTKKSHSRNARHIPISVNNIFLNKQKRFNCTQRPHCRGYIINKEGVICCGNHTHTCVCVCVPQANPHISTQ